MIDPATRATLLEAQSYCKAFNIPVPVDLAIKMRRAGIFARAYKGGSDYDNVRLRYWGQVADAVSGYLESDKPTTSYKNDMKQAILSAFSDAFFDGYADAGGEDLPSDDKANAWLTAAQNNELSNVDALFVRLAMLRKEDGVDTNVEGYNRAEGYQRTLDSVYNQAVLFGKGNQVLLFDGDDGQESCDTCTKLKGQRHRASWWIAKDCVPPSGGGLDCAAGGHCRHGLFDKDGNQVTV